MSLYCGNCKQAVVDSFGLLYLVHERGMDGDLQYPCHLTNYIPANSALCQKCWEKMPESLKLNGEDGRANVEADASSVYVYAPADSGTTLWGTKEFSSIQADHRMLTYLRSEDVKNYFRDAQYDVILPLAVHLERDREIKDRAFLDRVIAYIERSPFRVHGMWEFAPGIIGVRDSYESGEYDVYFDPTRWGPRDPELWGEDGLFPSEVKRAELGVLQGACKAPPPGDHQELFQFAKRILVSKQEAAEWRVFTGRIFPPKRILATAEPSA